MSDADFVILSGAYASTELVAEFGRLPPAMLPIGNAKLYARQVALGQSLACKPRIALSLPSDYDLPEHDAEILAAAGVTIVSVAPDLTLSQSIAQVLERIDAQGALYLLHGDTLVAGDDLDQGDTYFVSKTTDYYDWGEVVAQTDGHRFVSGFGDGVRSRTVLCGFFAFSDAPLFRSVVGPDTSFIASLNAYAAVKPTAIQDAAQWFDFGHLNLYYQARRDMLVTRAFNAIRCEDNRLIKSSENLTKMAAEAQWYQDAPPLFRTYLPQFLGGRTVVRADVKRYEYELEYLFMPNLAELAVYSALPLYHWRMICQKCLGYLERCNDVAPHAAHDAATPAFQAAHFDFLIRTKTTSRLNDFVQASGFDPDRPLTINDVAVPSINSMIATLIANVRPTEARDVRLWHGDFFFGNILYDARSQSIKLVDPRGESTAGKAGIYGDKRYDRAKLLHSLIGQYDQIIANRVRFAQHDDGVFELAFPPACLGPDTFAAVAQMSIGDEPLLSRETLSLTALLFFAMLPLHAEDPRRQMIMLANGARLYHLAQTFDE